MSDISKILLEKSKKRRTYRQFLEEPVDIDIIKDCIMTAATAPSGADKQPWHFSIIIDPVMKEKIREESEKIEKEFYDSKITKEWQEDLNKLTLTWKSLSSLRLLVLLSYLKNFIKKIVMEL